MQTKKENSLLIPYRIENGNVVVFLQKRSPHSKTLPNHFSFFGGKLEAGETTDQALVREIKEELDFNIKDFTFLKEYHSSLKGDLSLSVYFSQVPENFEDQITVYEGEYGKFFSEAEIATEPMIIEGDKKILHDFFVAIKGNGNN